MTSLRPSWNCYAKSKIRLRWWAILTLSLSRLKRRSVRVGFLKRSFNSNKKKMWVTIFDQFRWSKNCTVITSFQCRHEFVSAAKQRSLRSPGSSPLFHLLASSSSGLRHQRGTISLQRQSRHRYDRFWAFAVIFCRSFAIVFTQQSACDCYSSLNSWPTFFLPISTIESRVS